ncbi:methyltransferase domain-containing protein [Dongia sp.]|uniref:methyltransferase domain-containing protein n=1 Tax=Dongia sp. TaxID=1977262 RepID=UPI003753B1C6
MADLMDAPPPVPEPVLGPVEPVATPPEDIPPLEQPYIKIAQIIWGESLVGPGGTAAILTLVKPFALDPSMTVMDFGSGLGGGTRAVSEEFGVWVQGFEPDAIMAEGGQELSTKKGIKKAEIKPCSVKDFQPKAGTYDCIFSSEALYMVPEKEKLLANFERALKARGQIALTDFVRTPGTKPDDPRLKGFVTRDGKAGHFWLGDDYLAKMKGLKFDVRVDEDLTATYRTHVIEAFVNFTQDPAAAAAARAHPEAAVAEVALWTKRVAALDSGALQLRRYYAIKMGSTKSS